MKIYKGSYKNINISDKNIVVAIGNFDGIHIGHQELLKRAIATGKKHDFKVAVMTFYPHPLEIIKGGEIDYLLSNKDKEEFFNRLGIDYLLVIDFDKYFMAITPKEFISLLLKQNIKSVVVGKDFKYGFHGIGSIEMLKEYFEVIVVDDVVYNSMKVSSTLIRNQLNEGNVEIVQQLLGHNYYVKGQVIHGNEIGKTIGFPTANIKVGGSMLPKRGVYLVKILVGDIWYGGMANIGYNPTINYTDTLKLEVHILDFDRDIYSQMVTVEFRCFIRNEKEFENKRELIEALMQDKSTSKKLISKY